MAGLTLGVLLTALYAVVCVIGEDSRDLDDRDRRRWFPHQRSEG